MDIIKNSLTILATLMLIACGSDSDNSSPAEIIFPEHLPKVNPNLSTDSQSGIWMVYRTKSSRTDVANDDGLTDIMEREIITNELLLLPEDEHNYYSLRECTGIGITPDHDIVTEEDNKNGYTRLYRSNTAEEYGEAGRIDTYFLSNQRIYGKGWKISDRQPIDNSYIVQENIEFFAIKVSDATDFVSSDEVVHSGFLTSDASGDRHIDPLCVGLQEHKYSSTAPGEDAGLYHFQFFSFFGTNSPGFEIYNGKSTNSDKHKNENNQVVGVQQPFFLNSVDNYCISSDLDCVNKYDFQSEILKNDSSGISFTAKLTGNEDLNNEVYIDTQVSVIIHPFEAAQETQE
jgi:hypothetical protein